MKRSGRKRKVFTTIALALSLVFGKPRFSTYRSSSSNFDNQTVHERVIDDREFNSSEKNNQQVILAKAEGSAPSNFPVAPPSGARPSRPATGTKPYVNPYRVPPRVDNQGPGLGAGANPAGAGAHNEFDDIRPIPDKQKLDQNNPEHPSFYSKKKKLEDECQPRILKSRIKEDPGLVRAAKKACKDQLVQADINHLEEQLAQGNMNPGIGSTPLGNGFMEHRGKNGGRIIVKEVEGGVVEIYGKSGKRITNQKFVIKRVFEVFG